MGMAARTPRGAALFLLVYFFPVKALAAASPPQRPCPGAAFVHLKNCASRTYALRNQSLYWPTASRRAAAPLATPSADTRAGLVAVTTSSSPPAPPAPAAGAAGASGASGAGNAQTEAQRLYQGGRLPPPPDLPSLMLSRRIIYAGLPLVAKVVELLIAQLLFLQYDSPHEPITMYINSSGSEDLLGRSVGCETEALSVVDVMKSPFIPTNKTRVFTQFNF
eukprot:GHVT01002024.1.p1 GENE.GHVT01002024.1~~GHVT01002024.1.p1  ORF type:complete len:221 (-),score=47.11 GHVT01002024.1:2437-3099(-)